MTAGSSVLGGGQPATSVLLSAREISRVFQGPEREVHAVRAASFEVRPGETISIVGPSGSGKSTLLQILGLLDTPTGGNLRLDGLDTELADARTRNRLRHQRIGFVFQQPHLVRHLSILENVALPLWYAGWRRAAAAARAAAALAEVGLSDRERHRPGQLSGGQRQRAVVARALIMEPAILLADEPTGSLDRVSADRIGDLLLAAAGGRRGVIIATHDETLAGRCGRRLEIVDGSLGARS
jgi:ABC-type lipoprotein export system ATPase subunit